jgi:hypothetical protein
MEMDNAQSADSKDEQREQVVPDASTEQAWKCEHDFKWTAARDQRSKSVTLEIRAQVWPKGELSMMTTRSIELPVGESIRAISQVVDQVAQDIPLLSKDDIRRLTIGAVIEMHPFLNEVGVVAETGGRWSPTMEDWMRYYHEQEIEAAKSLLAEEGYEVAPASERHASTNDSDVDGA